jgi:hypothetical protein
MIQLKHCGFINIAVVALSFIFPNRIMICAMIGSFFLSTYVSGRYYEEIIDNLKKTKSREYKKTKQ